jgi:hypothetical protein
MKVYSEGHSMNGKLKILPDIAGLVCFLGFVGLVGFLGKNALADADTLWHIKSGIAMLEKGAILTQDIFSHTAHGKDWIAHEWLAEVIMAIFHRIGGLPLVVIFYFLLIAFTYWLLFKIANQYTGEWSSFLSVLIAIVIASNHLLARPHIFTWFFGVITLYALQKGGRRLFLLPPLIALWSNLHGGVVLGLLLQGIFIAGEILERRTLKELLRNWKSAIYECKLPLLILLLSIFAVGINPFGYQLFAFQFQATSAVFITSIGEWKAPNLQELWYFRFYLISIGMILLLRKTRVTWTDRLLLLFFINASLTHVRHVSLAGIFLTPFIASSLALYEPRLKLFQRHVQGAKDIPLSSISGPIATLSLFVALVVASISGLPAWDKISGTLFPLPEKFSSKAVQYIKQSRPEGNMFNEYSLGGYLIYALDSPPPVFIDGRADMYGEKIFTDYTRISRLNKDVDELLTEYRIDWVIYPTSRPLTRYLKTGGAWKEVYADDQATILVRKESNKKVELVQAGLN